MLGYTLLWTGIQNFRGNKTSVLEAMGLKGADSSSSFGGGSGNPSNQPSSNTNPTPPSTQGIPAATSGGTKFV